MTFVEYLKNTTNETSQYVNFCNFIMLSSIPYYNKPSHCLDSSATFHLREQKAM